jgi:hypothetical protein
MEPPIYLDPNPFQPEFSGVGLGTLRLRTVEQFQNKIAQFPKGTTFYLTGTGEGSWYYQQRAAKVKKIVQDAGMKLVGRPSH